MGIKSLIVPTMIIVGGNRMNDAIRYIYVLWIQSINDPDCWFIEKVSLIRENLEYQQKVHTTRGRITKLVVYQKQEV